MLTFSNPGELDIRLAITFGANVKLGDSPIGFFGTGLKYAIAGIARLGGRITIYSGLDEYTFSPRYETIRGKPFQLLEMHGPSGTTPLGFTSELGRHWEPWMLYRELYSNVLDEGGSVQTGALAPAPGQTTIHVDCEKLDHTHATRQLYFLDSVPITALGSAPPYEVHVRRHPRAIYLKGIRVGEVEREVLYAYNLSQAALTEDRTLASLWGIRTQLERGILTCTDRDMLKKILTAGPEYWEHYWDFDYSEPTPSPEFIEVVTRLAKTDIARVNMSAVRRIRKLTGDDKPTPLTPTPLQAKILGRAAKALKRLGFSIQHPVVLVETLGEDVMGLAHDGMIYITLAAMDKGTKYVASTMLEEHLHLSAGLLDCSREMQNFLFDRLLSFGEQILGDPI